MKKAILFLIIFLSLVLSSCGKSAVGELSASRGEMKEMFPGMFTITEEECGHKYLFYLPIDGMNVDLPPDEYHFEYCMNPNCEHEDAVTPHTDRWKLRTKSPAKKYEDGSFYHSVIFECYSCKKHICVLMRCKAGKEKCQQCYPVGNLDIYSLEDWRQIAIGNKKTVIEELGGDK